MMTAATATWCSAAAPADLTGFSPVAGTTADCTHGTPGWTQTLTATWTSAGQLAIFNYDTMLNTQINDQTTGFDGSWTFQLSSQATGAVSIDTYQPFDNASCVHGASIVINVADLVLPDGQQLQWLQTCSYSMSANCPVPPAFPAGAGSNIFDPPVGYGGEDHLPFYYDVIGGTWQIPADGHFEDSPQIPVADDDIPHYGTWNFATLLASWNGNYTEEGDNVVTVYGRIDWGYTFQCTPEPTSLALLAGGGLMLLRRTGRTR